jgi:hypothetical protein
MATMIAPIADAPLRDGERLGSMTGTSARSLKLLSLLQPGTDSQR